jgi:hypothetical protein
LLVLHVPPDVELLRSDAWPTHNTASPAFAVAPVFTDTTAVRTHTPLVWLIVEVPGLTPDTTPVPELTSAILVLSLIHVPPVVVELKTVVLPLHRLKFPVMTAGVAPTVNATVAKHPAST